MTRALVLGGGGIVGIAWEIGVLRGLRDGGAHVAGADLTVGTSAGSVVGTQLAARRNLDDLYAAQLLPSDGEIEGRMQEIDLAAMQAIFLKWGFAQEMTQDLRAEIGGMALRAKTAPEAEWVAAITHALGVEEWPDAKLVVTAVDAESGAFQTWSPESGVPLALAVASSCAVPGLFPPVTITGRRYVDGGVRSGTSVDLATGYDDVLVIAPIGESAQGIGGIAGRQLAAEVEAVRASGSTVQVIVPDAAAVEAFGPNLMDPARRTQAVETGQRQGLAMAESLRTAWPSLPVGA